MNQKHSRNIRFKNKNKNIMTSIFWVNENHIEAIIASNTVKSSHKLRSYKPRKKGRKLLPREES